MRVYLDTNVFVSAFLTRGICADLLELVLEDHTLVTGEVVLEELADVLLRKFDAEARAEEVIAFLRGVSEQVILPGPVPVRGLDKEDARVLGEALAGDVEVLVTGDGAFRLVGKGLDRPLVTDPRGFWELLRGEGPTSSP